MESQPTLRSISRYANFDPRSVKIHPLKRLAGQCSRLLPKSWRFPIFGLPPRGGDEVAPEQPGGEIRVIERGTACKLGAHLDRAGAYIPGLTLGAGTFMETRFLQRQRCFPRVRTVAGTVASLTFEGHVNYYRWLMETLPRMRFLREIAYDRLYAAQRDAFHRESLCLLARERTEVISCEQAPFLRADKIVVPRFIDESEPWIVPWLREQFLPLAQTNSVREFPRRIYITRRKATSRKTVNEDEVLDLLGPKGFVPVVLEDYGWLEQVALFRDAEIIVGPHGAGLANLVFSSPPLRVIELIAENYPFTFFDRISRQLKLDHHQVICEPVNRGNVAASDIRVPVSMIRDLLAGTLTNL